VPDTERSDVEYGQRAYLSARSALLQKERKDNDTWGARAFLVFRLEDHKVHGLSDGFGNSTGNIPSYCLTEDTDPDGLVRALYRAWQNWKKSTE